MPFSLFLTQLAETNRIPFRLQMHPIAEAFHHLGKWLKERTEQMQKWELASRMFPIIRFYNDAITVWIDASQHHSLGPSPPPLSVWDHLAASGRAFWNGLGRVGEAVQEDLILPEIFGTIAAIVDLVWESIERFSQPTPEMFDPSKRTASDLFGEVGLGFRAVLSSLGQIRGIAEAIQEEKKLWLAQAGGGGAPSLPTGAASAPADPNALAFDFA